MLHAEPNHILRTLTLTLNIAGALVAAVVLISGAWLVFGPLAYNTADASQRIETLRDLLQDEDRVRAEHGKLRQQLEAARQQDAALQKRIPDGPHEADFLGQVSHAAGEVGVQISDYRPGKMTEGKSCSAMRVELSCEGNYRNICRLLDRLQELPRHSTVARLMMDSGTSPDKHTAKIGLELYFFESSRQLAER
jgi:Tfp pilus assembly protein PilO